MSFAEYIGSGKTLLPLTRAEALGIVGHKQRRAYGARLSVRICGGDAIADFFSQAGWKDVEEFSTWILVAVFRRCEDRSWNGVECFSIPGFETEFWFRGELVTARAEGHLKRLTADRAVLQRWVMNCDKEIAHVHNYLLGRAGAGFDPGDPSGGAAALRDGLRKNNSRDGG